MMLIQALDSLEHGTQIPYEGGSGLVLQAIKGAPGRFVLVTALRVDGERDIPVTVGPFTLAELKDIRFKQGGNLMYAAEAAHHLEKGLKGTVVRA